MINKLSIAIAFSILLMHGVNNNSSSLQASEIEENILADSIEAIQKILKFGIDLSNLDRETLDTNTDTQLMSFKDLMKYLPDTPRGWTAQKPQGETNSFGDYGISQVSQTFNREDSNKEIKVSIFDGAFNSILSAPFLLTTGFNQESTESYNRGVTIDDIPGREVYNYSSKKGSLHLLVDNRFLVQIEGSNIEEADLRKWWRSLDRQSLRAIALRS